MAAQAEKVGDDILGGPPRALAGKNEGVIAEGDDARVDWCPPQTRGRRNRGGRQSIATHRAAAIDDKAEGELRLRPLAGHQFVEGGSFSSGARRCDGFEAAVDVEFTGREIGTTVTKAADPGPTGRSGSHDIDHDAPGELPGERSESFVGCSAQFGEQRERVIGVVAQGVVECRYVELSDIGRDLLEPGIAGERLSRRGAPRCLGERILCFLTLERALVVRFGGAPAGARLRAQAFPGLALEVCGAASASA